jgi:magnesium chelatase family protein
LLFVGPPGAGKSMLASRLVRLLPPPSRAERIEISRVLSAVGRWPGGLARERPYRAPHHTSSYAGLVGGGSSAAPGEITLAHCGVLFLDELPEFRRESLVALRQPLESGAITLSRAGRRLDLPARFQLVCAMNPCPCGYRGHPAIPCRCPAGEIFRYRRRISGPLLDRIDLRLELPAPEVRELGERPAPGERGAELVSLVAAARERMRARQGPTANAQLDADALDRTAPLGSRALALLEGAATSFSLSARAVQTLRRVARTLADLEGRGSVEERHLKQALGLRAALQ